MLNVDYVKLNSPLNSWVQEQPMASFEIIMSEL